MQADARLGRAGSAGHRHDPGPAGELADRVGHVGGGGLVPAGDEGDVLPVDEGIEQRQIGFARHAEDMAHAGRGQDVEDHIGCAAIRLHGASPDLRPGRSAGQPAFHLGRIGTRPTRIEATEAVRKKGIKRDVLLAHKTGIGQAAFAQ